MSSRPHLAATTALLLIALAMPHTAGAQAAAGGSAGDDGWHVAIYPVLAWVPSGIDIDVTLPPGDGDAGFEGEVVDTRFDGAFLGGLSIAKSGWRLDADGVWAAVGGDRPQLPQLRVEADLIYFHVSGGRRIVKDLYVTGGVRRLALKYEIEAGDLTPFERKPGLWDPLVGVGWHTVTPRFEVHASFEGGGFGVGSEAEYAVSARVEWKPLTHFGIAAGYQWLYVDFEDVRARERTLIIEQTLQGPILGVGFYF